jgi:sec-independent protein translocase protein TatA
VIAGGPTGARVTTRCGRAPHAPPIRLAATGGLLYHSRLVAAMFGLGFGELVIILLIVLIMFGAGRLPELGESLGRGIRNFRKAIKSPDEIDVTPEDEKPPARDQEGARPKQP